MLKKKKTKKLNFLTNVQNYKNVEEFKMTLKIKVTGTLFLNASCIFFVIIIL